MEYNNVKEVIDHLNRAVVEKDRVIKCQKEMIKNLCSIVIKEKQQAKILTVVCLN